MHSLTHRRRRNLPKVFEGRSSRFYDFAARRLLRGFYRRLADDLAGTAPHAAAVLDVGTGPGVLLVELAKRRPDLTLTGVDLSADMVGAANRNVGRIAVHVGDVTHLPFPDGSFDVVVSSLSLHHWDEPAAAAPELARILRPGGRLCVYDMAFAPFDALESAAAPHFAGPAQRVALRTVPRCVRFELTMP
jgi:ubiquinone/menaquinone biosynthesis C-methylase UbiE